MRNGPTVDIIIPTFNQAAYTVACARSLAAHTPPGSARVLWVDNGSAPAEREQMAAGWQGTGLEVVPLLLGANIGFVKGTNVGIAVSTAPYLLLLNNDTELPAGWLEAFLAVMQAEPAVGLVGPRSSTPSQWQGRTAEAPGYTVLPADAMLAFFCTLLRREVVVSCGYLSEEWGVGWGDDDEYSMRAERAGWRLALRTDVTVLHHGGVTFNAAFTPAEWDALRSQNLALLKSKEWYRNMWQLPR